MPKLTIGRKSKKADFIVPRAALELWRFAGTDKNRHNINGVCFEPEKLSNPKMNIIHAVTTDGHRMFHASWTAEKKDQLDETILLSPQYIRKLLDLIGKPKTKEEKKSPPTFRIKQDGFRTDHKSIPEYFLTCKEKRMKLPVSLPPKLTDDGKMEETVFPEWRHVIPRPLDGQNSFSQKFGVNLDYITDFAKYLKACSCLPYAVIHYSDEGGKGPVHFKCTEAWDDFNTEVSVEYIQMPVRA